MPDQYSICRQNPIILIDRIRQAKIILIHLRNDADGLAGDKTGFFKLNPHAVAVAADGDAIAIDIPLAILQQKIFAVGNGNFINFVGIGMQRRGDLQIFALRHHHRLFPAEKNFRPRFRLRRQQALKIVAALIHQTKIADAGRAVVGVKKIGQADLMAEHQCRGAEQAEFNKASAGNIAALRFRQNDAVGNKKTAVAHGDALVTRAAVAEILAQIVNRQESAGNIVRGVVDIRSKIFADPGVKEHEAVESGKINAARRVRFFETILQQLGQTFVVVGIITAGRVIIHRLVEMISLVACRGKNLITQNQFAARDTGIIIFQREQLRFKIRPVVRRRVDNYIGILRRK